MERGLFILFLENKMCVWQTINKIMVPIFQIIHTRNKILNPCASGGLEWRCEVQTRLQGHFTFWH